MAFFECGGREEALADRGLIRKVWWKEGRGVRLSWPQLFVQEWASVLVPARSCSGSALLRQVEIDTQVLHTKIGKVGQVIEYKYS
jgi:hypothetical protein